MGSVVLPPHLSDALSALEKTVIAAKDPRALQAAIGTLVLVVGRTAALLALATARLLDVPPVTSPLSEGLDLLASRQALRCLTMTEAAKQSGVLENTLREAGRRGELPIVHIGRYVYVRQESLERWIAAHESKG